MIHAIFKAGRCQAGIDGFARQRADGPHFLSASTTPRIELGTGSGPEPFGPHLARGHEQMHVMVSIVSLLAGQVDGDQDYGLVSVDQKLAKFQC